MANIQRSAPSKRHVTVWQNAAYQMLSTYPWLEHMSWRIASLPTNLPVKKKTPPFFTQKINWTPCFEEKTLSTLQTGTTRKSIKFQKCSETFRTSLQQSCPHCYLFPEVTRKCVLRTSQSYCLIFDPLAKQERHATWCAWSHLALAYSRDIQDNMGNANIIKHMLSYGCMININVYIYIFT